MAGDDLTDGDVTAGGSIIIEGKSRKENWTPPESYAENFELIEEHLKPVLGKNEAVFHELFSDLIHLDVLVYPPNDRRDYWVYVTSGMGDIRMATPSDIDPVEWSRCELMLGLPAAWGEKLADQLLPQNGEKDDDDSYWPIGLLKWLARYPHMAQTWFAHGHTIPNCDDEPYTESSRLNSALIAFSTMLPEDKIVLKLPNGDDLNFYGVTLLYPEELDFKLQNGSDALADKLSEGDASEVVHPGRRSVIKKNPLLRLLGRG